MKIHLFQELLELEEEFGHVIHGLERMEKDPTCKKEMRAEKESGGLLSVNKSTLIQ
jgi:hypothetical protein